MSPNLKDFFADIPSADFSNEHIHFGESAKDYPGLREALAVSVLDQQNLLQVCSQDNLKFLQGQLTCDVREVTAEQWRYGALCTPKGRMVANFLLAQPEENRHLISLPTSATEALQNTLGKFAPFYKGTVEDVSTHYLMLGLSGARLPGILKEVFNLSPGDSNSAFHQDAFSIASIGEQQALCWLKAENAKEYLSTLLPQATLTSQSYWNLLNIQAGLGQVEGSTSEEWTPHMLNLQVTGAISFTKGCYTGQEIVARTEYKGQQKKAMYRIEGKLEATGAPQAGTPLLSEGKKAGEIVMAEASTEQTWEALAVLSEKQLDNTLSIEELGGSPITVLTLPYSLEK